MENEKKETVTWLTKMEQGERVIAMMILALFAMSGVCATLFGLYVQAKNENTKQIKINASMIIDCEKQKAQGRIEGMQSERHRADSIIAAAAKEDREYFLHREQVVDKLNPEIYKRLKP